MAEANLQGQVGARVGMADGFLDADPAALIQRQQVLVEGLHALLGGAPDGFAQVVQQVTLDQVADMRRGQQQLHRHRALLFDTGHQALADQGDQVLRQVGENLPARLLREEADDAFQGVGGAGGVQGGQAQVAGFGVVQGVLHAVEVTDLSEHDHVRRLTQDVAQGVAEAVGVEADLALVDHRALVLVQELDRVLDAEDMAVLVAVAVIEHRRQGGRLARPGGADHQDQAAIHQGQFLQLDWQAEGADWRDLVLDQARHHRHFAALVIDVDPEAPRTADADRQVHFQVALEFGNLFLRHQLVGHVLHRAGLHDLAADRVGQAFDLELRLGADAEEHVRAAEAVELLQIGVNIRPCGRGWLVVHAGSVIAWKVA